MTKLMQWFNAFMKKIKEDNPNANWKNLLTGAGLLALVAVFSVWYFGNQPQKELPEALSNLANMVNPTQKQAAEQATVAEEAEVLEGEGLWQVAQRVCGDGEAYNYLADANGMTIWSAVHVGQKLKVACK